MAAAKKKGWKVKFQAGLTYAWKKIIHNWSWYDSFISGVLMLVAGYVLGWAAASNQSLQVTQDTLLKLLYMWGVFMFTGRGWQIARYPRKDDYKLVDLAWRHIFHLNYVAWVHFAIAIIFAYALAPAIGELAHAWTNGK